MRGRDDSEHAADGLGPAPAPGVTGGALADVAVVVVNYGSSLLVERNLSESLGSNFPGDVVVVDSWSTARERRTISDLCSRRGWRLVAPAGNPGFGGGCNLGAAKARKGTRVLIMLNPDARIALEDLAALAAVVRAGPKILAAPLVLRPDGRVYSSITDLHLDRGEMRARDSRPPDLDPELVHEWISGACFGISAELWEMVSGFDEDYFLYWEDVDLCRRVTLAGGEIVFAPDLRAVHDEGGTHGRTPDERTKSPVYYYYNIRNRLLYAQRHLEPRLRRRWVITSPRAAYHVLLQGGKRQLVHGRRTWLPALRGLADGVRGRTGNTF